MALEVPGSYITKQWILVRIERSPILYSLDLWLRMRLFSLLQYLPHPYDDYYDYNDFEMKKLVVYWSIENSSMPFGYWHTETGKCLWGNAAIGIRNNSQKFQEKFFSKFDLDI